jgi:putative DNA primase/helicase
MLKEAALKYIADKFPVFPLCWPDATGKCGCGRNHQDRDIGKRPLTEHGLKDATITILGVNEYWGKWPKANIGIAIPDGFFVLDADIEHNGYDSLGKLQESIGALPETLQITTGSGGAHFWYKTDKPIRNTVKLAAYEGLDIRGVGGYVVAPPSLHRYGQRYEVSSVWNGPIMPAPEALIELCLAKQTAVISNAPGIEGEISEGTRDSTLTSLAGSMRRRGLPESVIYKALCETNQSLCKPPLPDSDIQRIAKSVGRYVPDSIPGQIKYIGGV